MDRLIITTSTKNNSPIGYGTIWPSLIFNPVAEGDSMPSSQLKRAEKAIETILGANGPVMSAEVGLALQELLDAVRSLEHRITTVEKSHGSV